MLQVSKRTLMEVGDADFLAENGLTTTDAATWRKKEIRINTKHVYTQSKYVDVPARVLLSPQLAIHAQFQPHAGSLPCCADAGWTPTLSELFTTRAPAAVMHGGRCWLGTFSPS